MFTIFGNVPRRNKTVCHWIIGLCMTKYKDIYVSFCMRSTGFYFALTNGNNRKVSNFYEVPQRSTFKTIREVVNAAYNDVK
jgi:hypothetical protein